MNNYKDRGAIKWQPFNSIINGSKVELELAKAKQKVTMPILLDEEILSNEENLIKAFKTNMIANIKYFDNYQIKELSSKIIKINYNKKEIILEHNIISFYQIIKINI